MEGGILAVDDELHTLKLLERIIRGLSERRAGDPQAMIQRSGLLTGALESIKNSQGKDGS
jgi:hypothetical protein